LWERSERIADAFRVRGSGLSIDRDPSPQLSPTRGEGADFRCGGHSGRFRILNGDYP
jgi:hypothetical protein